MFCRTCGHKLVEGVRFCPYCGEPTEDVATDEEPAELTTVTEPVTFEPTRGILELVAPFPDNTHGAALVVTSSREGPGQFVIEASRIENGKLVPDTYLKSIIKSTTKGRQRLTQHQRPNPPICP